MRFKALNAQTRFHNKEHRTLSKFKYLLTFTGLIPNSDKQLYNINPKLYSVNYNYLIIKNYRLDYI
jgi:hypothetical protein